MREKWGVLNLPHEARMGGQVGGAIVCRGFRLRPGRGSTFSTSISFVCVTGRVSRCDINVTGNRGATSVRVLQIMVGAGRCDSGDVVELFGLVNGGVVLTLRCRSTIRVTMCRAGLFGAR